MMFFLSLFCSVFIGDNLAGGDESSIKDSSEVIEENQSYGGSAAENEESGGVSVESDVDNDNDEDIDVAALAEAGDANTVDVEEDYGNGSFTEYKITLSSGRIIYLGYNPDNDFFNISPDLIANLLTGKIGHKEFMKTVARDWKILRKRRSTLRKGIGDSFAFSKAFKAYHPTSGAFSALAWATLGIGSAIVAKNTDVKDRLKEERIWLTAYISGLGFAFSSLNFAWRYWYLSGKLSTKGRHKDISLDEKIDSLEKFCVMSRLFFPISVQQNMIRAVDRARTTGNIEVLVRIVEVLKSSLRGFKVPEIDYVSKTKQIQQVLSTYDPATVNRIIVQVMSFYSNVKRNTTLGVNYPFYFFGSPGTGKTSSVEKLKDVLDCNFWKFVMTKHDVGKMEGDSRSQSEFVKQVIKARSEGKVLVVLIDEADKAFAQNFREWEGFLLRLLDSQGSSEGIYDRFTDMRVSLSGVLFFFVGNSTLDSPALMKRFQIYEFKKFTKEQKKKLVLYLIKDFTERTFIEQNGKVVKVTYSEFLKRKDILQRIYNFIDKIDDQDGLRGLADFVQNNIYQVLNERASAKTAKSYNRTASDSASAPSASAAAA